MTGHLRVSMATVTTAPDESYMVELRVELRGLEPLTPCLQSRLMGWLGVAQDGSLSYLPA